MEKIFAIIALVLAIAIIGYLIWHYVFGRGGDEGLIRLPLDLLGYKDIPAVPFSIEETALASLKLLGRSKETSQALNGLSEYYKINGHKANARSFLYGQKENTEREETHAKVLQELEKKNHSHFRNESLLKNRLEQHTPLTNKVEKGALMKQFMDEPEQFAISWTSFCNVYDKAEPHLEAYANTLKVDAAGTEAATKGFWSLIANHGMAFNLLVPQRQPSPSSGLLAGKKLFKIDMRLFEQFDATLTDDFTRFTPGVIVHLYQDESDLNLLPYKIEVFKDRGAVHKVYEYGADAGNTHPSMWMYALQAAKTAITVWGIWLGHVYHWHIVTAALQLTMFKTLEHGHPVRSLLDNMSEYLIGFDGFLLLAFEQIAPPTSFKTPLDFIALQNTYAHGRNYHDDDPIPTLERLGITAADFTSEGATTEWDKYPTARYLLKVWSATETYVTTYVHKQWPNDDAVISDAPLHNWLNASRDPKDGNIMGIPGMDSRGAQQELIQFLTSYIYRITAHGNSRMGAAANPVLSFVGNFPPCLQSDEVKEPSDSLTQKELLRFLPNTATIGSMLTFLFTFVFSAPYKSFIPTIGKEQDLFFDDDELNAALIKFREQIQEVIEMYEPGTKLIHQWPRNIET